MDNLVAWLLEQIAEDVRLAVATDTRAMPQYRWELRERSPVDLPRIYSKGEIYEVTGGDVSDEVGAHIARWDPARVLTECEVKRRIVDESLRRTKAFQASDSPFVEGASKAAFMAVKLLAASYADRSGYRGEWRP